MRRHPIQNIEHDDKGVIRFARNEVVRFLLDNCKYDLNEIYLKFYESHPEDYEQLMMLIGYSLSGFGDLCADDFNPVAPCKYKTLAAAERKKSLNSKAA